ncbi:MAG: decarboxylating 6-phosphogluconate dehydrogenase [Synergistales bacterium]|nr:decarboxylating 6-phosphogluconate dehydrogenase [Synergistales bacterium]
MGRGIAKRLLHHGFEVYGYNRTPSVANDLGKEGLIPCESLEDLISELEPPRFIWMMLPSGKTTEDTVKLISGMMKKGDCLIDGSNSDYRNSVETAENLAKQGFFFVDMGVSGGIWGENEGFGLMFGAEPSAAEMILPFVKTLAPDQDKGWVHTGPPGSGHFVKMIHNAIEYGMMQAYAEGFELMRSKKEFDLDLAAISEAWTSGTVIRSWILDLVTMSLSRDQGLEDIIPRVSDSGEARWALREAMDLSVPVPVLSSSLFERFSSRDDFRYRQRLLAVIRNAFGGHHVEREESK